MKPSVGIVGVGVMGLAICQRLCEHGFTVTVFDINTSRMQLAAQLGAQLAANAREVATNSAIIFVVVLDADQISQVLTPDHNRAAGLLGGIETSPLLNQGLRPTILLCSTIATQDAQRFGFAIQQAGAWVLDAPISGGPARASQGTMSIMLAGSSVAINCAQPVLDACSDKQFYISANLGDAMSAKLVNNLMAASNLVAAAQAMQLGVAMGLEPAVIAQIAGASSGKSWIVDDRVERYLQRDYEPRAQLHVLTKDVTLACDAAAEFGVSLPIGHQAASTMQAACAHGCSALDDASVFEYWAIKHASDAIAPLEAIEIPAVQESGLPANSLQTIAFRQVVQPNSDLPCLVFLHGVGAGSAGWLDCLSQAKTAGRNAVAWEAPGYVRSTALAHAQPDAMGYAATLWALLDALGIDQVHLVGHSMGAIVASQAAALACDRVAAITLLAPARGYLNAPEAIRKRTRDERIAAAQALGMEQLAQQRAAALLAPNASSAVKLKVQQELAAVPLLGYVQGAHLLANADVVPLIQPWRQAKNGALVIACGDLDAITPADGCKKLALTLGARYVSLGAIGHMCQLEAPSVTHRLLGLAS